MISVRVSVKQNKLARWELDFWLENVSSVRVRGEQGEGFMRQDVVIPVLSII